MAKKLLNCKTYKSNRDFINRS